MGRFDEIYRRSIAEPEAFWAEAAEAIHWSERWDKVLDDSRPPFYRWFAGGRLNTCYNCLDRHVKAGRGEQLALIYDSPVTETRRRYTYRALTEEVARFAGALAQRGVGKGDRVILYMPMVPEAAIAMLACARLGAVHSVVFGGFAANELATRIDDCQPKLIVSASCGIEVNKVIPYKPLLDAAIIMAVHKPESCIILQRPMGPCELTAGRDVEWGEAMAGAAPADCVPVAATDPLYILYTSGTTGQPKGVVRDNGGHAVALAWSMANIYDIAPGEVFWTASDVGWVVGHSYIVYAPLLQGATTVLYEGKPVGTPDAGAFWRVIAEHGVVTLFTAPDGLPRHQARRSRGPAHRRPRPLPFPGAVPGGRAAGPADPRLGGGEAAGAGDRSLVADGIRLAHGGELPGHRASQGEARLADPARAGLGHPQPRRRRAGGEARRDRGDRRPPALAARQPAHPLECR